MQEQLPDPQSTSYHRRRCRHTLLTFAPTTSATRAAGLIIATIVFLSQSLDQEGLRESVRRAKQTHGVHPVAT